jgi:hypothetical protein
MNILEFRFFLSEKSGQNLLAKKQHRNNISQETKEEKDEKKENREVKLIENTNLSDIHFIHTNNIV